IFNVLIEENGLCMFVHGDNGKGMHPGKILQPSTNKMKGGGNRGQYFVGALNSMLSTGAAVVFEFSKEDGKKLKLMKYKAGPMIDHVRDRFAQGEDGNTITRELYGSNPETGKFIMGPYVLGAEDDSITDKHLADTFGLCATGGETEHFLKDFADGKETGTVYFHVFSSKYPAGFTNEDVLNYFERLPYLEKGALANKVDYWLNGKQEKKESPVEEKLNRFFDGPVIQVPCLYFPDEQDAVENNNLKKESIMAYVDGDIIRVS
ncbi:unnamed protein product, partial [marine sediment metagenome]